MKRSMCYVGCVVLCVVGCGKGSNEPSQPAASVSAAAVEADHDHREAPHGGILVDWGGGAFHVEFTVDHDAKSATVYILGDDAKTAAPVRADMLLLTITDPAFQVELVAHPETGETQGSSSRFLGTHENLGIVREFAGTISGEVDGTPYAADFDESAEDHQH